MTVSCACDRPGPQVLAERPASRDDFACCLRYTLRAKLAPQWNVAGELLLQGRDFLQVTGPINAVRLQVTVTGQSEVTHRSVTGQSQVTITGQSQVSQRSEVSQRSVRQGRTQGEGPGARAHPLGPKNTIFAMFIPLNYVIFVCAKRVLKLFAMWKDRGSP